MTTQTKQKQIKGWQAICQRCFHLLSDHPKNHDGNRPCGKEMKFTGMSVFCYCTEFTLNGNTRPMIIKEIGV